METLRRDDEDVDHIGFETNQIASPMVLIDPDEETV